MKTEKTVTITLPLAPLVLLFILLKVTNVVEWEWLWILSPLWISSGFVVFIIPVIKFFTKRAVARISKR